MIRVTRKYRFSASHRLHTPALGDDQNRELYGKCNNPFGHGHNYEIAVTVCGSVEPRSGHAVDLRLLDDLVERQILSAFADRNLNQEVPAFQVSVPTSENLGREAVRRLKHTWPTVFPADGPRLERVHIAETSRNGFEVTAHEVE